MSDYKEYKVKVYKDCSEWYNEAGQLHRVDGPAVESADGTKSWYLNDNRHREDGPAIEFANGTKHWYLNGKCHRVDGPAFESPDGTKHWYLNGKLHREDGPAIEYADGDKEWYLEDVKLTEAKFRLKMKRVSTCAGKIVMIDGKQHRLEEVK